VQQKNGRDIMDVCWNAHYATPI